MNIDITDKKTVKKNKTINFNVLLESKIETKEFKNFNSLNIYFIMASII